MNKQALVLLSGGLDSTTCLALAKNQGFHCVALSFDYGQRHHAELRAAQKIAQKSGVIDHHIISLDTRVFSGSALTDQQIQVPTHQLSSVIPVTYVPGRNTLFLSYALSMAESLNITNIFIGVSAVDYSNYPDCRPAFIEAFEKLANLSTKLGVETQAFKIHAPLIHLTKAETILMGHQLGVDFALTISCYQADDSGRACGACDSCLLRQRGFEQAGIADPTHYSQ